MSEVFENDIDNQLEDLKALEDSENIDEIECDEDFVFPENLFRLKLE